MSVIYLQFKSEFEARPGAKVHLSDIARVSPSDDEIAALEFDIPKRGRSVDAVELAARVSEMRPRARIELLGAGGIFVSRPRPRRGLSAFLIKALLVLFLFGGAAMEMKKMAEAIKYAVIIVSTLPMLCLYPFAQKYFAKGVMLGAIKG